MLIAPFTVVNGKVWPVLDVEPAVYRFRVLNGSNARTYRLVLVRDGDPELDRVTHFPEEIVDAAQKQIPPEWLADDATELQAMLEKLMSRRRRVPDLIRDSRHGRVNPFPEWK